jgi:hypothetical protein
MTGSGRAARFVTRTPFRTRSEWLNLTGFPGLVRARGRVRPFLATAILVLAACGGRAAGDTTPPNGVSESCAEAMSGLTDALTELDSRLSVGMAFSAYSDKVAAARVAYDRVDFDEMDTDCILGVGKPEEDAFNAYVRAYNLWNDCIGDTSCSTAAIESELQAEWSTATSLLVGVKGRLP